jgi:hypothetical protein
MTNLRRRLKKLEVLLTDDAGLIPHSPQWLAYWKKRLEELVSGHDDGNRCKIPLEAVDAIIAGEATIQE